MRTLRVLVDHQIFLAQTFGGVSRYFVETMCAMREQERGIRASILAPYHRNAYLKESPQIGAGFCGPSFRGVGRLFPVNEAVTAAYNRLARPDIVHETYYTSRRNYLPSQKVVTTVYDMIHELFAAEFSASDVSRLKREAVRRADHIVTISDRTREDLIEMLGVPPDKVTTIHLGVKIAQSHAVRPRVLAVYGPYVLYVGNRSGYKNFATLAAAIAMSSAIRRDTSLVCFGGPAFQPEELALFSKLHLDKKKIFHFRGGDDALAWLYSNAEMFVYPSRYEGFGIPPLEAMQRKCPVLCSNAGSLPEVVGDAALLFEPDDAQQLSQLMERVLRDSELRADLIDKGRSRSEVFSWEKCAERTASVYRRVVGDEC